ncbi:sensor histidine kinase [Ralstonia flatus]|uniref:histidine kinase n=2 Tax=Pseudomonadota TaxID=1224 RepID=A0AAD2C1E2_9RALS|nr:HAMP domain-containing sensor histidine kinase [Ralstonia sp. LMG 32965]MBN6208608.1 sensor histidine kinase [Ralstonia pickettii]CAJ0878397.1 Adaptive-response sensory-kinase SasA [Ralstonia sp. LMG 32965]CAJ0885857.1 Adaptive-response sensory-kinase SasA [Ralstonia sp. LMG 32965]
MPPLRSPDPAPARAHSLRARLVLWLALPLVVYVAADGWLDLAAARHNADLVHFHALDTAAQMISGQVEWDEGRLRVSVPPAALAVFAAPESPVRDQVTYQVSTEHGRLLAGRLDFGTRPAFDAAGLADAGTYTDTVEGRPVHVAAVVRTMYDAGRTERVVTRVAQTMNGRDAMIRQLWWPATVRQLALVGLALAMILIGLTLELRPILRLAGNVSARAPTDLAPLDPDGLQHELQPIAGAFNQYLQRIADNALTQKRFIADAAHQMRTPLAILDTQMQVAAQANADAALHEVLKAARTSTRNLADLINDLLLLSQAEASAATSEAVDLSQVARTVLEDLALLADGRQIDLGIEPAEQPVWTSGNRTLIAALLFNLVDNAVRYTQEGGHVTVQVSADYGWAMLTVIDNGPGIPPEAYTRVFERFTRLEGTQTQGSGLGLAIVRQIVDRMGGQIALAPGPGGVGLAVTVWLRRTSAPAAASVTASA